MNENSRSSKMSETGSLTTWNSRVFRPPASSVRKAALWTGRICFLLTLVVTSVILCFATLFILTDAETDLAESQFEAIADRALTTAVNILRRKNLGTVTMAKIAGNFNPDPEEWPFVAIRGYEEIATSAIATSDGREMGFCPIIQPEQITEFEDFAYNYFFNEREPPFPEGTAESSFGRGIWGVNPALNTSDNRYHEVDGFTSYGSPNEILTPMLHHNAGPHPALMLNLHFQSTRGLVIDGIMGCAAGRAAMANQTEALAKNCGALTDILILTSQQKEPGPGALLLQPVYPAKAPLQMKGVIASSIVWDEILADAFPSTVDGVDCVLESESEGYTYRITNGIVSRVAEGDNHEREYNDQGRHSPLMLPEEYDEFSVRYQLSVYPSNDFYEAYTTNNPRVAGGGAFGIVMFMALCFLFYDSCVRKEFSARRELLEAKRKFVRFVSHEVRTPLNSVCMGLTLLQSELQTSLDRQSSARVDVKKASLTEGESAPLMLQEKGNTTSSESDTELQHEDWHMLTEEIITNANTAVDTLNDLLNYDKIELGTLTLEKEALDIWNLIENTWKEFKLPASKKDITLHLEMPFVDVKGASGELGIPISNKKSKVLGDRCRLAQVFRNLISNAIKFTPDNGSIHFTASWHDPYSRVRAMEKITLHNDTQIDVTQSGIVTFRITDSGAGLTEEQLQKLFGQGVQFNVNALQAGNGSGLGLFIAKGIVEQHDGIIRASSPGVGQGTTFTIELPLYNIIEDGCNEGEFEAPTRTERSGTEAGDASDHAANSKQRILVVDDSATNRRFLMRWLRSRDHVCEEVKDGVEAVELVKNTTERFDSILMDYEMPRLNGPEATQQIRDIGCDSFIIGISGNVLPEDIAIFRKAGANAVLPKPLKFADLETLWYEYGVMGSVAPREEAASVTVESTMVSISDTSPITETPGQHVVTNVDDMV